MDSFKSYLEILGILLIFLMFGVSSSKSSPTHKNQNKSNTEKFEILDQLKDKPQQVRILHYLLQNDQIVYNGVPVVEWRDELGSDFEFSDGRVVSVLIYEGNPTKAYQLFSELDSIFNCRYKLRASSKARDWITFGEIPCLKYVSLFENESRIVSLGLNIYSYDQDEDNASKAQVVIGLGGG